MSGGEDGGHRPVLREDAGVIHVAEHREIIALSLERREQGRAGASRGESSYPRPYGFGKNDPGGIPGPMQMRTSRMGTFACDEAAKDSNAGNAMQMRAAPAFIRLGKLFRVQDRWRRAGSFSRML